MNQYFINLWLPLLLLFMLALLWVKLRVLRSKLGWVQDLYNKTSAELDKQKADNMSLSNSFFEQGKLLAAERERYNFALTKLKEAESDELSRKREFENLANRVIHYQSEQLAKNQNLKLGEILNPLKEKIKSFEDRIEKTAIDAVRQHESLKEQIKYLSEKSDKVSSDANNLAKALKGDYKKQGHWGELILESILEKSGLEHGREYFTQVNEKSAEGKNQRPDVVIKLPQNKVLIVDSKVSLSAYNDILTATHNDDISHFKKQHFLAIKKHVDDLSAKRYQDLYEVESPDFVLMFVAIDTAFSLALEYDANLYNYAFEKNIVIVTSSTLLATLKTVDSMWRNEKQQRYALDIAMEAGKMYDKFVGFLEDLKRLGLQLNTVQTTYNDSVKKLSSGSGNLIGRAEKIRLLGAKATKRINVKQN